MSLENTPVTYEETKNLLGVSLETIKQAAIRGVLTRLPREGLKQRLMRGQVLLFKDKRLSLSELNQHDRALWQIYANSVNMPQSAATTDQVPDWLTQLNTPEMKAGLGVITTLGIAELIRRGEPLSPNFMVALAQK